MGKFIQKIKCFFGFHVKGRFSRSTNRLFHHRQKYFCAVCGKEYDETVTSGKPWGG